MENVTGAMEHLKAHQSYPASKSDLVAACNGLADFSAEDKQEFENKLSEGTYNSAEEVAEALGWPKE